MTVEAMTDSLRRALDPAQRPAIIASGRAFLRAHFANMHCSALDLFEEELDAPL